ncbi:TPA: histidinol-phosphate transaminase [Legionella pneumophila]|jgi:histidinol-phosphate aminotransferase|uniref:Histidinol-phosphate aminotransferase n=1 Tax=Legionella pneumophila TaxID=446 RepID=A0AAN5R5B6_LEGPN|nr:histidinol-phosphate transaminase [Legionella pneumophila]HAT1972044.1 histidinol-phosphate transaminase [Legionella pneumophila]HAT6957331.1 histidinol-phosphate transaminase [Legionella pneumophila]HBC0463963.1 histidinol-phosphate transaminase [Legionella pneumophila]HEN4771389.1 histidinol-phosphate transaminase [Legionella pneumophila]
MSILNLVRPDLLNVPSYVPGGENARYRSHANELPWAPVAMDEHNLNYYPNIGLQIDLQKQLAKRYKINSDQIVLTRGSDDGIELVTKLFLTARKDAFMQFPPTFPMYAFYARLQQAEKIECPLDIRTNFRLTLEQIENSWKPNCKVIMFCSPNNPTGNLVDLNLIAKTCELYANQSIIVVDEAYIEFANAPSATTLIGEFENLIVLRTLSKAFGLAGLRLGCIIAQTHIIEAFNKIIAPYAIATPGMELAKRALNNSDWFTQTIERIKSSRAWVIKKFTENPIIEKIYPTETNFILIQTPFSKQLTTWLAHHGIAVRDFPSTSLLHDHLRITVGHDEQNQLLIDALSLFNADVAGLNYEKDFIY